jgi:hypothetical protein
MTTTGEIMCVHISLKHTDPKVWRRVEVPAAMTLGDLHDVIQAAMGWDDDHLHAFQSRRKELSEERTTLASLFLRGEKTLTYMYDFGDSWDHEVKLERRLVAQPGLAYPRLVDGSGRCPPEDIGGLWGYYDSLEALADPSHERHADMVEWYGGKNVDPAEFDRAPAEESLALIAKPFGRRGKRLAAK